MKRTCFILIFGLVSCNVFATTYIIKEGDKEVGRWKEDDGADAVHEIQQDKPKAPSSLTNSSDSPGASSIDHPAIYRDWYEGGKGYEEASKKQLQTRGPIFLYFYTTWCGVCKKFDKNTLPKAPVADYISKFPHVKIDAEKEKGIAKKYNVDGYPTFIVQLAGGKFNEVQRYTDPKDFLEGLKKAGLVSSK